MPTKLAANEPHQYGPICRGVSVPVPPRASRALAIFGRPTEGLGEAPNGLLRLANAVTNAGTVNGNVRTVAAVKELASTATVYDRVDAAGNKYAWFAGNSTAGPAAQAWHRLLPKGRP